MIKIAEGIIVATEFEGLNGGVVVPDEVLAYLNSLHYLRRVAVDG